MWMILWISPTSHLLVPSSSNIAAHILPIRSKSGLKRAHRSRLNQHNIHERDISTLLQTVLAQFRPRESPLRTTTQQPASWAFVWFHFPTNTALYLTPLLPQFKQSRSANPFCLRQTTGTCTGANTAFMILITPAFARLIAFPALTGSSPFPSPSLH